MPRRESEVNIGEKPSPSTTVTESHPLGHSPLRRPSRISNELERTTSIDDARSLASIDRPPSKEEVSPPKVYHPYSPHVLALLIPGSIFGALARVGLLALTTYDGRAIFPLAWIQAAGCVVMGFGLGLKEPIGEL